MSMRLRCGLLFVAAVLAAGALGFAEEGLRVAVMPGVPPGLAAELCGAYAASAGAPVKTFAWKGFSGLEEGLDQEQFDVVLGASPDSAKMLNEKGLVIPESDTILYYQRLTMFLLPGDPPGIMSAEDLNRPGVRVGLSTNHARGPFVDDLKKKALVASSDQDLLLDLLQEGRLDVVVGMDSAVEPRLQLVTIRLPRRAAGDGAAAAIHVLVAKGSSRQADAQDFIKFCAESREADLIKLSQCLMTSDGGRAASYREAGTRMMAAYKSVAKQIAEDYAKGRSNCLDLGCGPGQLTIEVAKATGLEMTGLDIEPEAIAAAEDCAREMGFASRTHWVAADVHAMPFPDNSFDVVMSRGSIFFWRDQATALREVMRVLKPGGYAFIGGGAGRDMPTEEREQWERRAQGKTADSARESFHFPYPLDNIPALMARAGINDYRHITEGGSWIEFRKPATYGVSCIRVMP